MADIHHDFPIMASPEDVFRAISTPDGIDNGWSRNSSGAPEAGEIYELSFGPGYDWRAAVTRCVPDSEFELQFIEADDEWTRTKVGFNLDARDGTTQVRFRHVGWPAINEHYRVSSFCWAMYLRILKRYVELGEKVPWGERLNA
jgi:uncharacterized protein YndB with AHSA1/START domain